MSLTHVPTELRRLVRERANGCCEYCGVPESVTFAVHEVDHIVAEKHGGETTAENLAFCCILCNRRKGSDLSSMDPLTSIGRATVRLLALNSEARLAERRAVAP